MKDLPGGDVPGRSAHMQLEQSVMNFQALRPYNHSILNYRDLEDLEAVGGGGAAHEDDAVEAARAQQCLVQQLHPVRGPHHQHLQYMQGHRIRNTGIREYGLRDTENVFLEYSSQGTPRIR